MPNKRKYIRAIILVIAIVFTTAFSKEMRVDVEKIFSYRDFIPNVPTIIDVNNSFTGGVKVKSKDSEAIAYRTKYDRWLIFYYDDDADENYAGVDEIVYTNIRPASQGSSIENDVKAMSFYGFKLGATESCLSDLPLKFRVFSTKFFGYSAKVYEFNPRNGESDLYGRFYVINDVVAGFSIGVTE